MTKERLEEVLENLLWWGSEHDEDFRSDMLYAMHLTDEEIEELDLQNFVEDSDEEDDEEEEY